MNTMALSPRFAARPFDMVQLTAIIQAVAAILLSSGWIVYLLDPASGDAVAEDRTAGTPIVQLVTFAVYLPALLFMLTRPQQALQTIMRGWSYSLLLAFAVVSILWSVEPGVSLRRIGALIVATLFIVHAANWFRPKNFVQIVTYVLVGLCVLSILAALVPGYGIPSSGVHAGRFRGIFSDKNLLGMIAAFAALSTAYMAMQAQRGTRTKLIWWGATLVEFTLVVLSNARTSLIGLVVAAAAVWAVRMINQPKGWERRLAKQTRVAIVTGGAVFVLVIVPTMLSLILALLGRNMTLTGRQKLWEYALDKGLERFWTGAGFKSFWTDKLTYDLRVLHQYWASEGQTLQLTSNAHNGYLDVWLELGIFGLILLLVMFITTIVRSIRCFSRTHDVLFLWHLGTAVFVSCFYMTNGFIMMHNVMMWFLMSYVFYSLSYIRLETLPASTPVAD